ESAKERGEIGKSLESLKEELRIAAAKQAEKEQEQQLQLSLKPDDVDTNVDVLKEGRVRLIFHRARGLASSSPSAVANGVVLAKLLRSSDGTVVYSSSTLRCAIDNWDGSCDINEELPTTIDHPKRLRLRLVGAAHRPRWCLQEVSQAQTKEYSRELLSLTFKPAALDPFSPAHVLARSKNSDQGEVSQVSLALTAAHEPSFESLRGHNQRLLLLELKIHRILHSQSLPDAVTAGVVAVHPSGEESTPEPVFHNFYYDQDQTLTLFLKEKFTDARRSGTSEPLVCITPGSAGTSVAPNWRRVSHLAYQLLVPDPTSALPKLKPVAVGNLDLRPLLDDDGVSSLGARSYHVDMRPLVSPHLTATLELDARLWRSSNDERKKMGEACKEATKTSVNPTDGTVEAVLAIARDREEVNAHLAREYTRRAESLEKASADVESLTRQLEEVKRENEELRERMEEEREMWDDAAKRAESNAAADPVLEAALRSLSSQQIVARLQETLSKYRNERATADELRRRLQAASAEIARAQRDRQRLEELERMHVGRMEYHHELQEKCAKLPKYEATIKSQEKIIAKLETVLEESLKKASKSSGMLSELTRLKAANDILKAEIKELKLKNRTRVEEANRENMNNRKIIEAKDSEIRELLRAITREEKLAELHGQQAAREGKTHEEVKLRAEIDQLERARDEYAQENQIMEARIKSLEAQLVSNSKHYGREISALKVQLAKSKASVSSNALDEPLIE
ncbi:hypothetical protein FOZ60_017070, partial [Perkinsus olseni]